MLPLVSVIIPTYNNERFLLEAVESILNQTLSDFELLIIDDGSTDSTPAIIAACVERDSRVRIHTNQSNMGIPRSRNIGVGLARGKYIAWLDSDDVACPDRLEHQASFLESHSEYGMVASDIEIIDEWSKPMGRRNYPHNDDEIRKVITRYNPCAHPASMIRASVFPAVGIFREDLALGEDYELLLRIASRYKVANISQPLIRYRVHSGQSKARYLKKTILNTFYIQKSALELGFQDSALNRAYRAVLKLTLVLPNRLVLWLFKKMTFTK